MEFDELAAGWDADDGRAERTRAVARQMRVALGERTYRRGLDFGAGTGSLSLLLADRFDEVVLVDTSRGMLDVAAGKVRAAGDALAARFVPLVVDLTAPGVVDGAVPAPVDVVYSLMALHHVRDVDALLRTFGGLLAPGGLLLLADLEAEDGSYHAGHADFDGHHGFARGALRSAIEAAGFRPVSHRTVFVVRRDGGREYPVFLAVAVRDEERD